MCKELTPNEASQANVQTSMIYFEQLLNDELLKIPFVVSPSTLKTSYHYKVPLDYSPEGAVGQLAVLL